MAELLVEWLAARFPGLTAALLAGFAGFMLYLLWFRGPHDVSGLAMVLVWATIGCSAIGAIVLARASIRRRRNDGGNPNG